MQRGARVLCCARARRGLESIGPSLLGFEVRAAHDAMSALAALREGSVDLLLLDLGGVLPAISGAALMLPAHEEEEEVSWGWRLLELLERELLPERRLDPCRIVALLPDGLGAVALERTLLLLGRYRVERVAMGLGALSPLLREVSDALATRPPGKRALCCSGGGVTGIYFELGAIKCLADAIEPRGALFDFDLYFGISAGAVTMGLIANGFGIEEVMGALAREEGGRILPISLDIFRLAHVDRADLPARLGRAVSAAAVGLWRGARGRMTLTLEALLHDAMSALGPPLSGAAFERSLHALFEQEGSGDDFRALPRALFIGATDQDSRKARLFGMPGDDKVRVSRAIRASMALNPAFSSVEIEGRFYMDGAVSRSLHVAEALAMGADLVFAFDPFVPHVSAEAGGARQRGMLYNIDQDVRTLSCGRALQDVAEAMRCSPGASVYLFHPANSYRRALAVNPMEHRGFLEIWRGAWLSTLRRLERLEGRLREDLSRHGLRLSLDAVREVARRLTRAKALALGDFFPSGRFELGGNAQRFGKISSQYPSGSLMK